MDITTHFRPWLTILLLASASCAAMGQNLAPAKTANRVSDMEGAAEEANNQIDVIAQAKEWPGEARITDRVEAVRLRITNNGKKPVQIRYSNICLTADDGQKFPAIPPLAVRGEVRTKGMQQVVREPLFGYAGYSVAPYYVDMYPGMVMYDGPFLYDSSYYDLYGDYWTTEALPTPEMLQWALPEGVLKPGGFVDGYVYFKRVPSNEHKVDLDAKLTAPESKSNKTANQEVASVSIPFNVK